MTLLSTVPVKSFGDWETYPILDLRDSALYILMSMPSISTVPESGR